MADNQQYNHFYQGQPPYHPQYSQYGVPEQQMQQQHILQAPQMQVVVPSRQAQSAYYPQPPPQYYNSQQFSQQPLEPQYYHPQYVSQPQYQPQYHQSPPLPQMPHQHQELFESASTAQGQLMPQAVSQAVPLHRVLQDVAPNVSRQQITTKPILPPEPVVEDPEPDYAILLLILADEYLELAKKLMARTEEYYRLIATGLGCIESVLTNFKLPALREAQLSLRYAQVLYDETENYDDAERVLTKGIDLCERNKFLDLKYAMQLLLARVLYESKPKAAIKDLQTMIEDVEAYRHTAWEYAFRFQLVKFYLSTQAVHDLHSAINQLDKLGNVARQHGDHAVLAFAAISEAQLHLQSSSTDTVSAAQRALAKARALQLNSDVAENPHMVIMMELIDLCCSIRESSVTQSEQKRKILKDVLYNSIEHANWQDDNLIHLCIGKRSLNNLQLQEGGLVTERSGRYHLTFSWMEKQDVEALGFLLCAVSSAHRNSHDGGKAERYIEEGLKIARAPRGNVSAPRSVSDLAALRRKIMECQFLIETAFIQCCKGRWQQAERTISALSSTALEVGQGLPRSTSVVIEYLNGVIQQGRGETDAALRTYRTPIFDLAQFEAGFKSGPSPLPSTSRSLDTEYDTVRNISILAAMNSLLIIHSPSHPQHDLLPTLLSQLDPLATTTTSKSILASYSLLLSILNSSSLLRSKKFLGEALSAAQSIGNAQITALTLSLMQEQLFKGQVGEQAIKCAKAASAQVRKWGEPMWMHVTAGMEAECYEVQGMKEEALKKREDARNGLTVLPDLIRREVDE